MLKNSHQGYWLYILTSVRNSMAKSLVASNRWLGEEIVEIHGVSLLCDVPVVLPENG